MVTSRRAGNTLARWHASKDAVERLELVERLSGVKRLLLSLKMVVERMNRGRRAREEGGEL